MKTFKEKDVESQKDLLKTTSFLLDGTDQDQK